MRIVCDNLSTDFTIPSFMFATKFRRFLQGINKNVSNYKTASDDPVSPPFAPSPSTANRQVAIIRDPELNLFLTYKNFVTPKAFTRRKELALLDEQGLSADPSIEEFLDRLSEYTELSEMLMGAVLPYPVDSDIKANQFDAYLDFSSWENIADYFSRNNGLELPEPDFLAGLKPPQFLLPSSLYKLRKECTRYYDDIGQHLVGDRHMLSRRSRAHSSARKLMPTVTMTPNAAVRDDITVACMLKESEVVVRRFIEHYQKLGVGKIKLYFDDPADDCIAIAREYDRVIATPCDDGFWGDTRKRAVEGRQSACYTAAYREQKDGWLIICDADEFVVSPKSIGELFDSCDASQRVVRFWSSEAVWDNDTDSAQPFTATHTRSMVVQDIWRITKGNKRPEVRAMFRNGMLSHRSGKYAIRVDSNARFVGLHRAEFDDGYNSVRIPHDLPRGTLVHFDAVSFDLWWKKMENRMRKGHGFFGFDAARKVQIEELKKYSEDEARAIFREMYHVNDDEIDILAQAGSLSKLDIFPK